MGTLLAKDVEHRRSELSDGRWKDRDAQQMPKLKAYTVSLCGAESWGGAVRKDGRSAELYLGLGE